MKKNTKPAEHQSLHKSGAKTKETNSSTSPSVDAKGRPVAENDNSENLFEEHIRDLGNKNQR